MVHFFLLNGKLVSWSGEDKQLRKVGFLKNIMQKRKIVCKRSEITTRTIIVIIELGVP